MKSFAVVVLVAALASLSSQQQQVNPLIQFRDECIKETGVEPKLVIDADQGNFTNDKKLQCFAKCYYKKQGFINDQGLLLTDVLESKLPPTANKEESVAVIAKCKQETGADDCETAFKIHKCFFEYLRTQAAAAQAAAAQQQSG